MGGTTGNPTPNISNDGKGIHNFKGIDRGEKFH